MRISDWSSDVCSSDLGHSPPLLIRSHQAKSRCLAAARSDTKTILPVPQAWGGGSGAAADGGALTRRRGPRTLPCIGPPPPPSRPGGGAPPKAERTPSLTPVTKSHLVLPTLLSTKQ